MFITNYTEAACETNTNYILSIDRKLVIEDVQLVDKNFNHYQTY